MVSIASLLGARHLWEVVENKPASSLVVSLGKPFNGTPRLYVEDRSPRYFGNSNFQASADYHPKHSDTSLSREWRINMAKGKKIAFVETFES